MCRICRTKIHAGHCTDLRLPGVLVQPAQEASACDCVRPGCLQTALLTVSADRLTLMYHFPMIGRDLTAVRKTMLLPSRILTAAACACGPGKNGSMHKSQQSRCSHATLLSRHTSMPWLQSSVPQPFMSAWHSHPAVSSCNSVASLWHASGLESMSSGL